MQNKIIYSSKKNAAGIYNIILDRDGVLNLDTGYPYLFEKMSFNTLLLQMLIKRKDVISTIHIATNQSGIARGYFSEQEFIENSYKVYNYLKSFNIFLNSIYYCPHAPLDFCKCRKPNNGMLEAIISDYHLDRSHTVFFGDMATDKEAAALSNIKFRKIVYFGESSDK